MLQLTKENITFVMSLIGSIGSILGWGYYWLTSHKNIHVQIDGYQWNNKGILLYIQFVNKSRLPICINALSIALYGKEYPCNPIPVKVLETTTHTGKEISDHKEFYSIKLPLNLSPLCGDSGYLDVLFEPEISKPAPTELSVLVYTNRGKALKKTLVLNKVLD